MKKLMILFAAVALMTSCSDDDEKIVPKDYGMKTFSADLMFEKPTGAPHGAGFTCKQQVYFKFGQELPVAVGNNKTNENWTTFDILPKLPKGKDPKDLIDNPNYNVTTSVKGWDLLFTQYVGNAAKSMGMPGIMPYKLAGVLVNTDRVEVQLYKHELDANLSETEILEKTKTAFADLKIADLSSKLLDNKKGIDAIGTDFRRMEGMPPKYTPNYNYFYIIKTADNDTYKLRFIGYKKKVITCEYALMK